MEKTQDILSALQVSGVIDDLIIPFDQSPDETMISRLDYLEQAVKGKNVLHLGCCDHIDLIDRKIADHTWLHGRLTDAANECYGIDNNVEAVQYLCDKGIKNIFCADLQQGIPDEIKKKYFDVFVLGEILEHINDPALFLARLHSFFDYEYTLIITVPNAFFLDNLKNVLGHFERINSDHRYWFTPYTISKICYQGNYFPKNIRLVFRGNPDGYGHASVIEENLYKYYPGFRDVIVVETSSKSYRHDSSGKIMELTPDDVQELFRWDSSPNSCEFRSAVKQFFLSMEKEWDPSAFERNTITLLNEIKRLMDKNISEKAEHERATQQFSAELKAAAARYQDQSEKLGTSLENNGKLSEELKKSFSALEALSNLKQDNGKLAANLADAKRKIAMLNTDAQQAAKENAALKSKLVDAEELIARRNADLADAAKANESLLADMLQREKQIGALERKNTELDSRLTKITGHSQYLSAELSKYETQYFRLCSQIRDAFRKILFR